MAAGLWFLTDGVKAISVFENRRAAEGELKKYEDDQDYQYFSIYSVNVDDLEDYPDEFDMALDEGLIG